MVVALAVTGVTTGLVGNAAVARADHQFRCGANVLASRARLLDRVVHDLAEGIEANYSRHPWFVRLLQESQVLADFTHEYVEKVAHDPSPACLLAAIQNVCNQFQRTERLLNAIGVPGCVQNDLARVEAVIELIERDLQPPRGRSFPAISNGVGAWTPDHGRIYGWPDQRAVPAFPRNGGFAPEQRLPNDGVIVPAPEFDDSRFQGRFPVQGPVLRAPAPVDYRQVDPRRIDPRFGAGQPVGQRSPTQIGVQLGNVRFSFPIR